jgi:hypothetical protein
METPTAAHARSLLEFLAEVPPRPARQQPEPSFARGARLDGLRDALWGARVFTPPRSGAATTGALLARALGFRREKTPCVATLHNVFKNVEVAAFEAALAKLDRLRRSLWW